MTTTTFPIHVVPTAGSALTALGQTLLPGRIYEFTQADADNTRDDTGTSWLDDLTDDAQAARWGRVLLRVAEIETARPGARKVAIRALADTPLQGRGRLAAGDSIVLTADLVQQLRWLDPEVQRSTHGHQVFVVEPVG